MTTSDHEPGSEPIDELLDAADVARRAPAESLTEQDFQIIRFKTGDREFAFTIDAVERTERIPLITSVPRSPAFIRGVATLRGGVVCVFDLRNFLAGAEGTSPADAKSMLVIRDHAGRRVGLLSETLPDFERVRGGETMGVPTTELDIYAGSIERDGKLVGLLDPGRLLDMVERRMVGSG